MHISVNNTGFTIIDPLNGSVIDEQINWISLSAWIENILDVLVS